MLRGRIVSANGIKAEDIKAQPSAAWVLHGDRGITFATAVPRGSSVVDGDWWGADYRGAAARFVREARSPTGSVSRSATPIMVNVLGRNIEARIANLRAVDWQNLGINFVLVFSPSAFAGAPHTRYRHADLSPAAARRRRKRRCSRRVSQGVPRGYRGARQGCDRSGRTISCGNLLLAVRGASAVALIAAVLGARRRARRRPAFSHLRRRGAEDLGATRGRLIAAYALEYLLLGTCDGAVRRGRRFACRLACRHPGHGISLCLGCRHRRPALRRRASGHGRARPARHVYGARP